MKKFAFALALVVLPATAAFAQDSGVIVRDPAGGSTRDPALGVTVEAPLKRDPAGGVMVDDTQRFRTYVMEQHVPSYAYGEPVVVGTVLPEEGGIVYREVPSEYGAQGYSYTVVNGRTVLVEPRTRRIVQLIN